ncbi:MAG: DMT family protein [Planctomycetaceae bacterium]
MRAITLLVLSNVFMTTAWYLHLRPEYRKLSLWVVILASWGIAFFEYCLQVPANRIGYEQEGFTAGQLKIIQEVITLVVFAVFSVLVLKETFTWRYAVAFLLILAAVAVVQTDPARGARNEDMPPPESPES